MLCVCVSVFVCVEGGGRVANIAAGNPCGEGAVFVFIFFALFAQQLLLNNDSPPTTGKSLLLLGINPCAAK